MTPRRGCHALAALAAILAPFALASCDSQETPGRDPSETADAGRADSAVQTGGDAGTRLDARVSETGDDADADVVIDAGPDAELPRDAARTDAVAADVGPSADAATDAVVADAVVVADAEVADAAPDAGPRDGGSGPSCVVAIDRFDNVGQVAATTQCRVAGPTETCAQLIDCICDFIAGPENHEDCVWLLLGPRALVALGDFCSNGRDLAAVCAIEEWQSNGPEPIRARAEPDCAEVIAN